MEEAVGLRTKDNREAERPPGLEWRCTSTGSSPGYCLGFRSKSSFYSLPLMVPSYSPKLFSVFQLLPLPHTEHIWGEYLTG